jgi:hypothetical protein
MAQRQPAPPEALFHRLIDRRARPQSVSVLDVEDGIGLAQAIAEGPDDERFDVELRHDGDGRNSIGIYRAGR